MPTNRSELETSILRRQTRAYIADAAFTTRFVPHPETKSPAGGKTRSPAAARKPQTVRLVALDRRASGTQNIQSGRPNDGVMRYDDFEILGEYDLEIEVGDQFDIDGVLYEITEVQPTDLCAVSTSCLCARSSRLMGSQKLHLEDRHIER
jgi:hypothetical protein